MGKLLKKTFLWLLLFTFAFLCATVGYYTYSQGKFPATKEEWRKVFRLGYLVLVESKRQAEKKLERWEKALELKKRGREIAANFQIMLRQYRRHFQSQRKHQEELETWLGEIEREVKQKARKRIEKLQSHLPSSPGQKKSSSSSSSSSSSQALSPSSSSLSRFSSQKEQKRKKEQEKKEESKREKKEEKTWKKLEKKSEKRKGSLLKKEDPSRRGEEEQTREMERLREKKDFSRRKERERTREKREFSSPKVVLLLKKGLEVFEKGMVWYKRAYQERKPEWFPKAAQYFQQAALYLEKARELEKNPEGRKKIELLLEETNRYIADCVLLSRM